MRRRRRVRAARRTGAVALAGALAAGAAWALVDRPWEGPGRGRPTTEAAARVPAGPAPQRRAGGPSATTTTPPPGAGTFPGPSGVEAAWVLAENRRPGSAGWRISGTPPGLLAGWADHTSAVEGDVVRLYVTTDAPSFRVDAYRMGWYGGAGARLVWRSPPVAGVRQSACALASTTNTVSCDSWTPSLEMGITQLFVPGDYLLELVGPAGRASYVPLTVRDPASRATYMVENDIYTWQAWNPWGGYDFYAGAGSCPAGGYPVCDRARVVSYDRPYGYGQGAADFLGDELPFVEMVEREGLDVTYATSADFEQHPSSLLQHRAVLSLGHDECWSYHERLAAVAAERHGVNVVFFGASPILRHVRMQPSPVGPYREEVDYRQSSADPLDGTGDPLEVTGNTWQVPPASWSEVPFVGAAYTGYVEPGQRPVDLVVEDSRSWLYTGTGLADGDHLPGLLQSDFDQFDPSSSPRNVEIMGHSPMPRAEVQSNVSRPASDITYYTDPVSGAGIFDTGTVSWIPDLEASAPLRQMTGNLLALFGRGPAGRAVPSVPDWRDLYG